MGLPLKEIVFTLKDLERLMFTRAFQIPKTDFRLNRKMKIFKWVCARNEFYGFFVYSWQLTD